MQLHRQDLIGGLRGVVRSAHENGMTGVSIRIVNGVALSLAHFERDTAADTRSLPPENPFESFYPGDARPERTIELLQRIFSVGLPAKPPAPCAPRFDSLLPHHFLFSFH